MQRAFVADTSPLNYLIAIDRISCLEGLFGRISIPAAVQAELLHPRAPASVRAWISAPPSWLIVHPDPSEPDDLATLDDGERKAIALACHLSASLILIDDRVAVAAARQRGLIVLGTLGVLTRAAARGLLDLPSAIDRLRATSFRCRPGLFDEALKQRWNHIDG